MKLLEEIVFRCRPTNKYLIDPETQVALSAFKLNVDDPRTWPKKSGNYSTNLPGIAVWWPEGITAEENAKSWADRGIKKYVLCDDVTKALAK